MNLAAGALAVALSLAPFQCAHSPDPNERREDSAGDALWALAQDCHAHGDTAGERRTLAYLVEKYPSSRHAPAAKDDLAKLGGGEPSSTERPAPVGGDEAGAR